MGALCARDPALLIDAWAQQARFGAHTLYRFPAGGRSGDVLTQRLAEKLATSSLTWAATGQAASGCGRRRSGICKQLFASRILRMDPQQAA